MKAWVSCTGAALLARDAADWAAQLSYAQAGQLSEVQRAQRESWRALIVTLQAALREDMARLRPEETAVLGLLQGRLARVEQEAKVAPRTRRAKEAAPAKAGSSQGAATKGASAKGASAKGASTKASSAKGRSVKGGGSRTGKAARKAA